MVGIIVALLASWILLFLVERSTVERLGVLPNRQRVLDFFVGLLIAAVCCFIYFSLLIAFSRSTYSVNPEFTFFNGLNSLGWILKSVLFEEFLFRGALLYLLIKYLGPGKACIISAVSFGIYHWFSYGILGNVGLMVIVFILTFVAGLLFAYAFYRTKSLYLPLGLHLGWNFVTIVIFSQGPLGPQLLTITNGQQIGLFLAIIQFTFQLLSMPAVAWLYLRRWRR